MSRASRALWRITRMVLIVFAVRTAFDTSVALLGHPMTWALGVAFIAVVSALDDD